MLLAVDAIRRGGADTPDEHNHAHTPLGILGVRDGKTAIVATG